jgi:hypothetical protein
LTSPRAENAAEAPVQTADETSPEDSRIEPKLQPLYVVGAAVRFLALPLTILWFFPGPDEDHVMLLGLNRAQIGMAIMFLITSWTAYSYWKYLLKARRLGGSLVVIDRNGVFCKERRQWFRWEDMFSVNAVRSYSMMGSPSLNLIDRDPAGEGADSARPSYSSLSWRLDATDVDVTALHGLVCELHREAQHPDDLYRR